MNVITSICSNTIVKYILTCSKTTDASSIKVGGSNFLTQWTSGYQGKIIVNMNCLNEPYPDEKIENIKKEIQDALSAYITSQFASSIFTFIFTKECIIEDFSLEDFVDSIDIPSILAVLYSSITDETIKYTNTTKLDFVQVLQSDLLKVIENEIINTSQENIDYIVKQLTVECDNVTKKNMIYLVIIVIFLILLGGSIYFVMTMSSESSGEEISYSGNGISRGSKCPKCPTCPKPRQPSYSPSMYSPPPSQMFSQPQMYSPPPPPMYYPMYQKYE
jgi:flagellar basal body-associated protein FliL